MDCDAVPSVTHFEHLSNELINDIFDYLSFPHIHESFHNLNIRFYNLINSSTCPVKINLSSISKSSFRRYYTHFIIPYQHRITWLRLSNPFAAELFPLRYDNMIRLQTLYLQNIESKFLENTLMELSRLPDLSALVVQPIDTVRDVNSLYHKIFSLPVLKYCNVTFKEAVSSQPLPFSANEKVSSIQTFLINHPCHIDQLNALLLYVPQIRHLSCHILSTSGDVQLQIRSMELKHLTHLSLTMGDLSFYQMEYLIRHLLNGLQVFYSTTTDSFSRFDRTEDEPVVISNLPKLRMFYVKLSCAQPVYRFRFNRQRQYEVLESGSDTFHSIQAIKHRWWRDKVSLPTDIDSLHSVDHVTIQNELKLTSNLIYLPNVTKLTILPHLNRTYHAISTLLDRIMPLTHLTNLTINCPNFCVGKLVQLLYYSPNIRILTLHSFSFEKIPSVSIQESETFEKTLKKSRITNVTITDYETVEHVKLLCDLCPRLQQLTVGTYGLIRVQHLLIVKFLFEDYKDKNRHLSSLCCTNANRYIYQEFHSAYPSTDISIKYFENKLHLWW